MVRCVARTWVKKVLYHVAHGMQALSSLGLPVCFAVPCTCQYLYSMLVQMQPSRDIFLYASLITVQAVHTCDALRIEEPQALQILQR